MFHPKNKHYSMHWGFVPNNKLILRMNFICYNGVIFIFKQYRINLFKPLCTGLTQSKERYLSENLKWMVKHYALSCLYSPLSVLFQTLLCSAPEIGYPCS